MSGGERKRMLGIQYLLESTSTPSRAQKDRDVEKVPAVKCFLTQLQEWRGGSRGKGRGCLKVRRRSCGHQLSQCCPREVKSSDLKGIAQEESQLRTGSRGNTERRARGKPVALSGQKREDNWKKRPLGRLHRQSRAGETGKGEPGRGMSRALAGARGAAA